MNRYAVGGRWRRRGAASVSRLAVPLHTYGALNLNTAASYASAKAHVARVCINASETWWIVVRTSVLSSLPHVQHPSATNKWLKHKYLSLAWWKKKKKYVASLDYCMGPICLTQLETGFLDSSKWNRPVYLLGCFKNGFWINWTVSEVRIKRV